LDEELGWSEMGEQPSGRTCEIGRRLADSKLSPTSFAGVDRVVGGEGGVKNRSR